MRTLLHSIRGSGAVGALIVVAVAATVASLVAPTVSQSASAGKIGISGWSGNDNGPLILKLVIRQQPGPGCEHARAATGVDAPGHRAGSGK